MKASKSLLANLALFVLCLLLPVLSTAAKVSRHAKQHQARLLRHRYEDDLYNNSTFTSKSGKGGKGSLSNSTFPSKSSRAGKGSLFNSTSISKSAKEKKTGKSGKQAKLGRGCKGSGKGKGSCTQVRLSHHG